jgi:hypothetical protein
MDEEFRVLSNDEVLYVNSGRVLMSNPTFKVGELLDALAQLVSEREDDWSDDNEGWFGEGLDCEALRFGNQGWQRGRVRIRLEFCPNNQPRLPRAEGRRGDRGAERETPREATRDNIYTQRDDYPVDYQEDFESDY